LVQVYNKLDPSAEWLWTGLPGRHLSLRGAPVEPAGQLAQSEPGLAQLVWPGGVRGLGTFIRPDIVQHGADGGARHGEGFAEQRVGEVPVDVELRRSHVQAGGGGGQVLSLLALYHGYWGPGLAVLTHHPVVGPLDLLLAVIGIEEKARFDSSLSTSSLVRGLVLLSSGGVVTKPEVELSLGYPVRVEVCGKGRDVPHIGIVHQGIECDRASVEIVQYL